MRLVDRLSQNSGAGATPEAPAGSLIGGTAPRKRDDIAEGSRRLKIRVHNRLLETLDVSKLDALEPAMVSGKVTSAINETLNDEGRLLTDIDRARLISEIKNELLGLGPLEPLLHDDDITDILVNGHSQVYVEKFGKLHHTDVTLSG
jgi:pilus assembly protein CpaF